LLENDRFFIPMVPPYINPKILKDVQQYTDWIGFNLFELRHSKFYNSAKKKSIRDTFEIDDKKKIFLTSITKDKELKRFYDKHNWIEEFKSDVRDFDVNMAMGPDWFSYKGGPKDNIQKAIELNMNFLDLEIIVPTIRGTNFQEVKSFIEPFKALGRTLFVFTGREYLVNLADRKRAQFEFFSLTSKMTRIEKIKLIVTGCNSPKLQESLPAVLGFAGLGWLIQSRQRRLIMGKIYKSIFDPKFSCVDPSCCASIDKKALAKPENDSVRATHNLRKINANLKERSTFSQTYLPGFYGDIQ
jgi:hypothetical protein